MSSPEWKVDPTPMVDQSDGQRSEGDMTFH